MIDTYLHIVTHPLVWIALGLILLVGCCKATSCPTGSAKATTPPSAGATRWG